jgi:hypothetical protein
MRRLTTSAAILAMGLVSIGLTAAPAQAGSPWFHLTSGARPTHIRVGASTPDVQELSVTGSTGTFCLAPQQGPEEAEVACMPDGSEASLVEAELKAHSFPNNRALTVTREATATGDRYVIAFPGQDVPPMWTSETAEGFEFGEAQEIHQVAAGAPDGQLVVTAANLGDGAAEGTAAPIHIGDALPAGFKAVSIEALAGGQGGKNLGAVRCTLVPLECTFEQSFPPFFQIEIRLGVIVENGAAPDEPNEVTASGGGAREARISRALNVEPSPTPFGLQALEVEPEEVGGTPDTQAGSHPFQFTTTIEFNQGGASLTPTAETEAEPLTPVKDLHFKLPAGLIGNPAVLPRCSLAQFAANTCPAQSALGAAIVTYNEPRALGINLRSVPIYNLEPATGEPARFGFLVNSEAPIVLDASVRTGSDYGVTVSVSSLTEEVGVLASSVTFWGVPGDPRHDAQRGEGCLLKPVRAGRNLTCTLLEEAKPPAFLRMPTSCSDAPLETSAEGDTWSEPSLLVPLPATQPLPMLDGCGRVPFGASVNVALSGDAASAPSGLNVDVHVPQGAATNAEGLAPSDVKDVAVTLPEGVALNPSAADGLAACTTAQIALTSDGDPTCPDASKIANVTIHTPVLANPLKGFVYLASPQNFAGMPQENPFGSLVAMYIVAKDPVSGVLVKLSGRVALSETGRISTTIENSPQLPFEDAELEFFGGDRAPIASPAHCGSYTTDATFTPWSGGEPVTSSSTFAVTTGPNGAPCPGSALPFAPSLAAGTANANAGSFSSLSTTIGREDGNQDLQSLRLRYPAGLAGVLAGVKRCAEAQANAGTCGPESEIGETTTSVGLGGDPYAVTGGKVYLTEKYQGAPFGLSIVTPAKAGPFVLQEGKPVVVRASIEVDPSTAALTITTGAIPRIIDGIPLQIKRVNVTITRPGFTFNPTSCERMAVTGAINGAEGASSPVSVPFQVTNCAALKFAPSFAASTSAKTSKANGASLHVKIGYPNEPLGSQANIAKVDLTIPATLPTRLTTLQKACTEAQFNANPDGCPVASKIATATVHTPVFENPLSGPVYFVSHGGAAFPDTEIVLRGEGVTLVVDGKTQIKNGITYSRFESVPDEPFTSFEFDAPEGPYSIFTANANLCQTEVRMPTTLVAQNGAVVSQSTLVEPQGCPNKLTVVSRKVKRRTLTLKVAVPAAGALTATGNDLAKVTKTAKGRGTLTLVLRAKGHGKLRARVKLGFVPTHGRRLGAAFTTRFAG